MALPTYQPASFASSRAHRDPDGSLRSLLDDGWSPRSADLGAELRALVPSLDRVRGPVARLLLGVDRWAARPGQIFLGGRTVTVGYMAGQSPSMMRVICADGGTFTIQVASPARAARGGSGELVANWAGR